MIYCLNKIQHLSTKLKQNVLNKNMNFILLNNNAATYKGNKFRMELI